MSVRKAEERDLSRIAEIYVFESSIVKGFIQINKTEICKLYVDPCFQGDLVL